MTPSSALCQALLAAGVPEDSNGRVCPTYGRAAYGEDPAVLISLIGVVDEHVGHENRVDVDVGYLTLVTCVV